MTPADTIRIFITPLLPGWRVQFGRWHDGSKADRYAVLRPVGGRMDGLVRRPQFTLMLVAALGDAQSVLDARFVQIYEAARAYRGDLVSIMLAEPVATYTHDGRAMIEVVVSTIANQLEPAAANLVNGLSPQWDDYAEAADQGIDLIPPTN